MIGGADSKSRVAVTSRSFSKNPVPRKELLDRYSNVTFNDQGVSLSNETLVDFLWGHDKAIITLEKITDELVARLPELRVISKYGVGIDNIYVEALRWHGIHARYVFRANPRPDVKRRVPHQYRERWRCRRVCAQVEAEIWRSERSGIRRVCRRAAG